VAEGPTAGPPRAIPHCRHLRFTLMSRSSLIVAALVFTCVNVGTCGHADDRAWSAPRGQRASSNTLVLTCSDSVGQQGRGGEVVVAGVEGLVLTSTGDVTALSPIRSSRGQRYFLVKDFLAVSAAAAPYATVAVVSPRTATLSYGRSSDAGGPATIAASRRRVRFPVCGPKFTGFVGGIVVTGPTKVTFAVSSPRLGTRRIVVPIGTR
jgi:hypothetical protein